MKLAGALAFAFDDATTKRALMLFDELYVFGTAVENVANTASTNVDHAAQGFREALLKSGLVSPYGRNLEIEPGTKTDAVSRTMAADLTHRLSKPVSAVTLSAELTGLKALQSARVVRIVLDALPLPNAQSTIDAILEWRADADATVRHRRMRAWISRLSSEASVPDPDELATLLDDYNMYMAAHFKKMSRTRIAVLVTTAASIVEDLSRLRLANAMEKLFKLYSEEATVLEAELAAPGREIAYIAAARDRFAS